MPISISFLIKFLFKYFINSNSSFIKITCDLDNLAIDLAKEISLKDLSFFSPAA